MDVRSNRELLLSLLHEHGILYASPTQPVRSRDGTHARWMLDSLGVSLTTEGLALAGEALLRLLERFEGRQVATYGVTAITLLSAAIMQSGGRYHGLIVRPQRKPHGSSKLIEGRIDPDEPVIMLDDSVASGTNMRACYDSLTQAGLRVEGGVCLVRFGWYGGFARMREMGLQMESVYDIWDDFMYRMPGEADRIDNPTRLFPKPKQARRRMPEGLHPATLARRTIETLLRGHALPQPPARLDRDYDAMGGAWVSVREKDNIYLRHARDGYWNLPGDPQDPAPDAVIRAAAKTAEALPKGEAGLKTLDDSAIAVTFFSELEPCTVGQLDNDRYGIVVRSKVRAGRMGGALPRMPGISTAWQQFQHARTKNADMVSFEPYEILRHDVEKAVEPGTDWQPTGVPLPGETPWHQDPAICAPIAGHARQAALRALGLDARDIGLSVPDHIAQAIDTLFVTVYVRGATIGCMGSAVTDLSADVENLTRLAVTDNRFAAPAGPVEPAHVAVTVSLLHSALTLGDFTPQEVMVRIRTGQQALMVYQGDRSGILLPQVAAASSLSPDAFALEVIDKAGITRPPYHWRRFECATWLAGDGSDPRLMRGTEPLTPAPEALDDLLPKFARAFGNYLQKHQRDDGQFYFRYLPLRNLLYEGGDPPRTAHAAWVLRRAGASLGDTKLMRAGDRTLKHLETQIETAEDGVWIGGDAPTVSISEISFYALAVLAAPRISAARRKRVARIAETLWSRIDHHGRIDTHRAQITNPDPFQDYFPGQALLALAAICAAGESAIDKHKLDRTFRFYRHRFRFKRDFGAVSWLMQAFARWHALTGDPAQARFVHEIADWLLEHQQASGAFINGHQSDTPGYTTALYLEGLGAAARMAEAMGDTARAARYREACRAGFRFLDGLVIKDNMKPLLPNPNYAIGGLRQSLYRDDVRIDFVQHALSAVLELYP